MSAPRLLDLFAGAGGCSVGYARAGFDVTGVDIEPHPDYPFEFILGDAMDVLSGRSGVDLNDFDVVHASPPCQAYSDLRHAPNGRSDHPELVGPVRDLLLRWGGTYVIENVVGAPLRNPLTLCGSEFDLTVTCRDGVRRQLRRHRLFESNAWLMGAGGCLHRGYALGVYGDGGGGPTQNSYKGFAEECRQAMGIDWMTRDDLSQAIPPAYTEHIGSQLLTQLEAAA